MHCETEMKYFLILLISTGSLLISVSGGIPDWILICSPEEPEFEECIRNSIYNLRPELAKGIPELSVPSLDPCYLQKLIFNFGDGFTAEATDLNMTGASSFEITDLVVDLPANTYSFTVSIAELIADGKYNINASIASIALKGNGPIHFEARSVVGKGTLYGKKVIRGGKTYIWFSDMNMKLDIGNYDLELKNLFEGDRVIGKVANELLNGNKALVLDSFRPALEKALIEFILVSANNICKNFSFDELFPKSTKISH